MNKVKILMSLFVSSILLLLVSYPQEIAATTSKSNVGIHATFSKVMTYDQMIEQLTNDLQLSSTKARQKLESSDKIVHTVTRNRAIFRVLSHTVTVNKTYKPTMRFYCETSESGHFRAIKRIVAINLVREDQKVAKAFSGTVYVNLEEANRIYYIVNGDRHDFMEKRINEWCRQCARSKVYYKGCREPLPIQL
ncbi:hypothetical protein ACTPIS_000826 [Enterococcus hirae]